MPITLTFSGPHHINHNPPYVDVINHLYNFQGIYIWGFMYDNNTNLILDGQLNNAQRFIPYYVGITGIRRGNATIASRINSHIRGILKPRSTYLRLTMAYMSQFFNDPTFPHLPQGQGAWVMQHPNNVTYMNNQQFFDINHLNAIPPIYNIGQLVDGAQRDTLANLITSGNFYFFSGQLCDDAGNPLADGPSLTQAESYVKYSLRGKTVSRAGALNRGLQLQICFENPIYNYLKLDMGTFNRGPNAHLLGYAFPIILP